VSEISAVGAVVEDVFFRLPSEVRRSASSAA
jgi:hypothetical protein